MAQKSIRITSRTNNFRHQKYSSRETFNCWDGLGTLLKNSERFSLISTKVHLCSTNLTLNLKIMDIIEDSI